MAQVTEVRLVDDLDGGEADETVGFAVDGKDYMIDLSAKNATRLREALEPFVGSARKASAPRKMTQTSSSPRTATDKERTQAIKAWAYDVGLQVAERGRIAVAVIEAYDTRGTDVGEAKLNDLLVAQGSDRTAPTTNPEPEAPEAPVPTSRADVTDELIVAYREAKGLPIQRRKGKLPTTYLDAYCAAMGITD
jgi:hypothetical protein